MVSKRNLIIAVAIALLVILTAVFIFVPRSTADSSILNSSLTKENYYIEKSATDVASSASLAVENFANQDKTESKVARNKRLANYFTADSPVFDHSLDNIGGFIDKSVAKTTSVSGYELREYDQHFLRVMVNTRFYVGKTHYDSSQTYWLMFTKQSDGYSPYNIGISG